MRSYAEWRALLAAERLPCAVVDLDAFDRNLAAIAAIAGGRPVRLATKSLRVVDLVARALKPGGPFRGLLCYSPEEAAFLNASGFDDLLVAYPTLRASDLAHLRALHERGVTVRLVVDG